MEIKPKNFSLEVKSLLLIIVLSIGTFALSRAQQVPKNLNDSLFSTYYQQRVSLFRTLPIKHGETIFLGNSISDGSEWSELFDNPNITNRGISGDKTAGILNRLDEIVGRQPSKIFLLIGTNDLEQKVPTTEILHNIFLTAQIIQKESPSTQLYIQSILPVNDFYKKFTNHTKNGDQIIQINKALAENTANYHYKFIDIHTPFADLEGKLKKEFSNDGLHLNGQGYQYWKHLIYNHVFDLKDKPSLLPLPQKLSWKEDLFPLYAVKEIIIADDSLKNIALNLQDIIRSNGYFLDIQKKSNTNKPIIELKIATIANSKLSEEAYELSVNANKVTIQAANKHGLFNGIQTLRQLMRSNSLIQGCEISDYPEFPWRGYMIDVGRNYQSIDLIKQQIDEMSKMKLNFFHFHLTEDVAWRLQVKRYPQLTKPETMTRFQGLFYSENEIKELIQYCKDRFITFVPEIDMPGHSAAFARAMGFDMQSDSGLIVVKQILQDFCDTYDLPYIHIGADEVKITNKDFLPTMIKTIEANGKKVIGWEPVGNFTNSVVRQLWMDDLGKLPNIDSLQLLDSRNLYINHMDVEESVVSIFNHAILDKEKGDHTYRGAILCLWNDRKLNTGEDNFVYNPVYPSLVAFAERAWRGGGKKGNLVSITDESLEAFTEFENRLIDIKKTFFKELPFPYVRQAHIKWQLIGPYDNGGDLLKSFVPEKTDFNFSTAKNSLQANGGTVILRHFWDPAIKGFLKEPKENSTYYAYTRYWSDADTTAMMWIGFYDFSRSTKSASPKSNTWSNLESKIWLNGKAIDPPKWLRANQEGDLEIPYIDENYYSRKPAFVQLKKGWNTILVKAPVGSFNSGIWYSPIKWMFSAMIVESDSNNINLRIGKGYEVH